MRQNCNASIAGIAGLLLSLGGAAQANEADDRIYRLAAQAREQVRTGQSETLVKTIDEIVNALPEASPDGVIAVIELNRYLASPGGAESGQRTFPATTPETGDRPLEPVEGSRALQQAVPATPESSGPPPQPVEDSQESQQAMPPVPLLPSPPDRPSRPAAVATPEPAAQTPDNRLVDLLRRQGDTAIGMGDISGARRYYRRGAEAGCGACAEALARTYDAEQLRRMGAVGIKPDSAQAEVWRVRARQLGWTGAP